MIKNIIDITNQLGTPLYIYEGDVINDNIERIYAAIPYEPKSIHFALMANNNIQLLKELRKVKIKCFCSSLGELYIAQKAGFKPREIIFCGSNLSNYEIKQIVNYDMIINAESIEQMVTIIKTGKVKNIGLRVSLNINVPDDILNSSTGQHSRLGIPEHQVPDALCIAKNNNINIVGLHSYVGTNILKYNLFVEELDRILNIAKQIKSIKYIDIGGGFGIPYATENKSFDWYHFGKIASTMMDKLSQYYKNDIELKLEPGRSIIASAGILLTKVVEIKKYNGYTYIGTDTNLSNFIRPYIYKQYHDIVLLGKNISTKKICVSVCGNTIASNDYLAKNIFLPSVKEGDILAIKDVGAYGYSMSSNFCCRLRPAEVLIKGNKFKLIRKRETYNDLISKQVIR